eukprot:266573_1
MTEEYQVQQEQLMTIAERFDAAALASINEIGSNHILFKLLSISFLNKATSIMSLAMQLKRTSFLDDKRVLMYVQQVWHHGLSIHTKPFHTEQNDKVVQVTYHKLLQILVFAPFNFYLSPVGYNYTRLMLLVLYVFYVLLYSYYISKGMGSYVLDLSLWILNIGYVSHTFSDWKRKRMQYLSHSMDILISFVWIILFVTNVYIVKAFSMTAENYKNINELFDKDWSSNTQDVSVKVYTLIFGIQIILLILRCLSAFRFTTRLGKLLIILQMMLKQIVWFLLVTFVIVGLFSSVFFFITRLENTDSSEEEYAFWSRYFPFEVFVGTNDEITLGSAFTGLLSVCIILVLMNLLVAVMTTEYETFAEIAQQEVIYMKIKTALDLANNHRIIPPPINILVHPLAVIIHILITLLSICSCHLYSKISRKTHVFLHSCGCNKGGIKCCKTVVYTSDERAEKVYGTYWYNANKWYLFTELSGMRWCCYQISYPIKKWRNDTNCTCYLLCGLPRRYLRRRRRRQRLYRSNPLKAYHKGCYNRIKLEVKDNLEGKRSYVIDGMTVMEYIGKYERINSVTLRVSDIIALQRLNADTLFCNHCYEPYTERQVDMSLTTPFHVLLDIMSCFLFLFTGWLPLVIFFGFMAITECLHRHCYQ